MAESEDGKEKEEISDVELEPSDEQVAEQISMLTRLDMLRSDPKVREATRAATRTGVNALIVVFETIPGIGEAGSVTAEVLKGLRRASLIRGSDRLRKIDLLPDVSMKIALLSEVLEAPTGTAFPSYVIPALVQLKHDFPRMVDGVKRAREIIKSQAEDCIENREEIGEAAEAFGVDIDEVKNSKQTQ